ncbi:hypothetical protein ACFQZW_09430 [Lutibacter aestuarii]|uniref:Uncharacterized protein n=1 Tax=Lutibacter aestuarii TaxID=861111 RepID=A0ABW2Z673_9FLAO
MFSHWQSCLMKNTLSRYFSEDAYKNVSEPKALKITPNGVHTDLYNKIAVIPFDKLKTFFKEKQHQN